MESFWLLCHCLGMLKLIKIISAGQAINTLCSILRILSNFSSSPEIQSIKGLHVKLSTAKGKVFLMKARNLDQDTVYFPKVDSERKKEMLFY